MNDAFEADARTDATKKDGMRVCHREIKLFFSIEPKGKKGLFLLLSLYYLALTDTIERVGRDCGVL